MTTGSSSGTTGQTNGQGQPGGEYEGGKAGEQTQTVDQTTETESQRRDTQKVNVIGKIVSPSADDALITLKHRAILTSGKPLGEIQLELTSQASSISRETAEKLAKAAYYVDQADKILSASDPEVAIQEAIDSSLIDDHTLKAEMARLVAEDASFGVTRDVREVRLEAIAIAMQKKAEAGGTFTQSEQTSHDEFGVNASRAYNYLHDPNVISSSGKYAAEAIFIPIGQDRFKICHGVIMGSTADRSLKQYQKQLFPGEFDFQVLPRFSLEDHLTEAQRIKRGGVLGGYDSAFAAGKTVLDIGSGEAIALMQLAEQFPDTSFIGLDRLYYNGLATQDEKDRADAIRLGNQQLYRPQHSETQDVAVPNSPGLQLVNGDWRDLTAIPDESIDTVISVQAISQWGFPNELSGASYEDGYRIAAALTRVVKPGGIVRADISDSDLKFFDQTKWEIIREPFGNNEERIILKKI